MEASLEEEVAQIERGPHDHLPEGRDIIGPVNSARRSAGTRRTTGRGTGRERCEGVPVCEVPPAEGPRGQRQCQNKRQRTRLEGGVEQKRTQRPLREEDSWGKHRLGWRNAVEEGHRPRRHRSRAVRRVPVREETPVEGAPRAPVSPGRLDSLEVALGKEAYR